MYVLPVETALLTVLRWPFISTRCSSIYFFFVKDNNRCSSFVHCADLWTLPVPGWARYTVADYILLLFG